jgi:hypothetical protein
MKSLLILCALFAFSSAVPGHLIGTPAVVSSHVVSAPLLAKVEGQAPASTVHAVHAKVVPQVIAYSVPATTHIVSGPIVSSPVISSYGIHPASLPLVSNFNC